MADATGADGSVSGMIPEADGSIWLAATGVTEMTFTGAGAFLGTRAVRSGMVGGARVRTAGVPRLPLATRHVWVPPSWPLLLWVAEPGPPAGKKDQLGVSQARNAGRSQCEGARPILDDPGSSWAVTRPFNQFPTNYVTHL